MYGDKPEPQVPKTVDFSGRRFQPLAAPHRRHVQVYRNLLVLQLTT